MEFKNRKSVNTRLKKFDCLAKDHSFIEVTEWTNGEGWDINIDDKQISLTMGELEAINYLAKTLDYEYKDNMEED